MIGDYYITTKIDHVGDNRFNLLYIKNNEGMYDVYYIIENGDEPEVKEREKDNEVAYIDYLRKLDRIRSIEYPENIICRILIRSKFIIF